MNIITNFLIFGIVGWCMEIMWTGLGALLRREYKLIGNTSIWMFFIYGLAAFMPPLCDALSVFPLIVRGLVYMTTIFAVEFATGMALAKLRICPWDYSGSRFAIKGVIRLDYAPAWFLVGIMFEIIHNGFLL